MRARTLVALFTSASLGVICVLLPLAIYQQPSQGFLVDFLRAIGCIGFLFALVAFLRSSGAEVQHPSVELRVPRRLRNNPLAAANGATPLAERIDLAMEETTFYRRALGVIHFRVISYERIADALGVSAADAAMDFALVMLQMALRPTDRAEAVGPGRFVVCLPLLPDRDALEGVRVRMANQLRRMWFIGDEHIEFQSAVAISPTHGRTGAELLAHAQRQCDAACAYDRAICQQRDATPQPPACRAA